MRFTSLNRWLAIIFAVGVLYGSWLAYEWHRHRILVLLPDGSRAENPSVKLDYDPVSDYHPTTLTGSQGQVYIPSSRAYGRGWETMHISATRGGKRYGARRYPSECSYPMRVTLEELPPLPPPPSLFEQGIKLLEVLQQIGK